MNEVLVTKGRTKLAKGSWETFELKCHADERGELVAVQSFAEIPFDIRRVYYMTNNISSLVRGLHAHKNLDQVLIAVKGKVTITCDDGFEKQSFTLDNHRKALRIKDLVWREIFDFTEDCVLLVLASELYDPADYIHDYELFLELAKASNPRL